MVAVRIRPGLGLVWIVAAVALVMIGWNMSLACWNTESIHLSAVLVTWNSGNHLGCLF